MLETILIEAWRTPSCTDGTELWRIKTERICRRNTNFWLAEYGAHCNKGDMRWPFLSRRFNLPRAAGIASNFTESAHYYHWKELPFTH